VAGGDRRPKKTKEAGNEKKTGGVKRKNQVKGGGGKNHGRAKETTCVKSTTNAIGGGLWEILSNRNVAKVRRKREVFPGVPQTNNGSGQKGTGRRGPRKRRKQQGPLLLKKPKKKVVGAGTRGPVIWHTCEARTVGTWVQRLGHQVTGETGRSPFHGKKKKRGGGPGKVQGKRRMLTPWVD